MKFAIATVFALALGAQADLASIKGVLSDISNQVDALDKAVTSFSGKPDDLVAASDKLLSTIKGGISTVTASAPLELTEATMVAQGTVGLNTSTATVVNDLISKKSALVAAGAGGAILKSLQDQKTAAGSLADAITSKVPTALQGTAKELSQGVSDSLSRGVAAFQGAGSPSSSSSSAMDHSGMVMPTTSAGTAPSKPAGNSTGPAATAPATSAAPKAPSTTPSASPSATPKPASTSGSIVNGISGVLVALAAILAF